MIIDSPFKPAWWLPGPHSQTLWPALLRRSIVVSTRRERLELPDGDFLDLDWGTGSADVPLVLLLHGLEGSVDSPYIRGMMRRLTQLGLQAVVMHFRGCSGEPNRLPRSYHSGETGDLEHVINELQHRWPGRPLAAVGYSLGGNVLLKWLGERRGRAPLRAAVAVSVPMRLQEAAQRMERGFSRIYQRHLLRTLRRNMALKCRRLKMPFAESELAPLNTFRRFDDAVTAPLHGFAGVDDYYGRSSALQYLRGIRRPTLILQARDDPFMTPRVLPKAEALSPCVTLELSHRGGHVGFVGGPLPFRPRYWLEQRVPEFLLPRLGR